jgi:hypothetical protein
MQKNYKFERTQFHVEPSKEIKKGINMTSDDPARKYLPKEKNSSNSVGLSGATNLDHGTFTGIAYGAAWAVSIIGTIAGLLLIAQAFSGRGDPNMPAAISGLGVVAFAWVSACGVGTLAEISRKLTHVNPSK